MIDNREEQIALIHEAFDTYEIHVNSTVNETKPLPEWIRTLASDSREIRDLTKCLKAEREVARARHILVEQFMQSGVGKACRWVWRGLRVPLFTVVSFLVLYAILKLAFPYLLGWFNLL